ncbi:MAG: hypothetical protein KKC26_01400 [Nanoarchaeota archaeon]|nr:hypothetical protein [Nanoarchaeota archaeon]MBU1849615.1 hypothetical protein [Nanoarchaeota archaeon]
MRYKKIISFVVLLLVLSLPICIAENSYIYVNDQLMVKVEKSIEQEESTIKYFQLDFNKNVRTLFDEEGNMEDLVDYLPFGDSMTQETLAYASKLRDRKTDLYGTYDASTGRSISPRPISVNKLSTPQALNFYSFPFNNPFRTIFQQALSPDLSIPETPAGASGKFGGSVSGAASAWSVIQSHAGARIAAAQTAALSSFISTASFLASTATALGIKGLQNAMKKTGTVEVGEISVVKEAFDSEGNVIATQGPSPTQDPSPTQGHTIITGGSDVGGAMVEAGMKTTWGSAGTAANADVLTVGSNRPVAIIGDTASDYWLYDVKAGTCYSITSQGTSFIWCP